MHSQNRLASRSVSVIHTEAAGMGLFGGGDELFEEGQSGAAGRLDQRQGEFDDMEIVAMG